MDRTCAHRKKSVAHVLGTTFFALILAKFIVYDLLSISMLTPVEKNSDFQISDIYQSVAQGRAIHQLSKDIIIVSIDGYGRRDVLDAVNLIAGYEPKAIGLDIFFPIPDEDNSYLLYTLSSVPKLVCAGKFERQDDTTFIHSRQSFYEQMIDVTYGYVNLYASSRRSVVRAFVPYVCTSTNDTLLSMPAQLARLGNGECYGALLARGNTVEKIAYEDIEFPVVPVQDVLSGNADQSLLTDKIILVGDIYNANDTYLTPLHGDMPGIMLHAYALQTVLSGNYINTTPEWMSWLIAVLLCILYMTCGIVIKGKISNFVSIIIRIVQFALIFTAIVVGSIYFSVHHRYIDFSPTILTIGFCGVASDIWLGLYALYNLVRDKIEIISEAKNKRNEKGCIFSGINRTKHRSAGA